MEDGAFTAEIIPQKGLRKPHQRISFASDFIVDTIINYEGDLKNYEYMSKEDYSSEDIVPGTNMNVAEFEQKLEAMYGIESIDVEIKHTIDGWYDSNNTMKTLYTCCLTFGTFLFVFSIPVIVANELKYRRLHNANYLIETELEVIDGECRTKPENHNKLIFAKGSLKIRKEGGITHCAKDDTL